MSNTFLFNDAIPYKEVRLKKDGKAMGIFTLDEVLQMGENANLDVVLITESANPPVVELCKRTRFLYEHKKREDQKRKNQHHMETKEVKFSVEIGQHDIEHKIKTINKIIDCGDKVKISIRLKHKQMNKLDQAIGVIEKVVQSIDSFCKPERGIITEKNIIHTICIPNKKPTSNDTKA